MELRNYINKHQGETAWLFGKGPSLATFDFAQAGALRCAINDVIAHVPDCVYGFANDGVKNWADVYKKGQTLFQPKRALSEFDPIGKVACDVVAYDDTQNDLRLQLSREEIAELPTIRRGTLGSALQILHVMGIRSVYMVGFDGGGTHAEGFEWKTRLRADHAKDYNAIRSAAIDAAFIMGIALKFHNHDHNMEPNGKVFVRMTRNCFAATVPYAQGEIASFAPHIAAELISNRCAEKFIPSQQTEIETAVAPIIEAEKAVIETKKPSKSRKK